MEKTNSDEALPFARKTCDCYVKQQNTDNEFSAYLPLLRLQLKNSDYRNFQKNISLATKLVENTKNVDRHTASLGKIKAQYYFVLGNYKNAKTNYKSALSYYENTDKINRILLTLNIAQINDELEIIQNKENITIEALAFLNDNDLVTPSLTLLHNNLATLNIAYNNTLSDSLFTITLHTHKKYKISSSPKIAIAYNGLGLNRLYLKEYRKADSLFLKAINQLDSVYGEEKNVNQLITYLNIAKSKFDQKEFGRTEEFLRKAANAHENTFKDITTIYEAYILELEADLLLKKPNEIFQSTEKYSRALKIAEGFLDKNHSYIVTLKSKITNLK